MWGNLDVIVSGTGTSSTVNIWVNSSLFNSSVSLKILTSPKNIQFLNISFTLSSSDSVSLILTLEMIVNYDFIGFFIPVFLFWINVVFQCFEFCVAGRQVLAAECKQK